MKQEGTLAIAVAKERKVILPFGSVVNWDKKISMLFIALNHEAKTFIRQ